MALRRSGLIDSSGWFVQLHASANLPLGVAEHPQLTANWTKLSTAGHTPTVLLSPAYVTSTSTSDCLRSATLIQASRMVKSCELIEPRTWSRELACVCSRGVPVHGSKLRMTQRRNDCSFSLSLTLPVMTRTMLLLVYDAALRFLQLINLAHAIFMTRCISRGDLHLEKWR